MAYEKNGSPLLRNILHFSEAFILKFSVANSKHLVDDQNFRFQMGCNGKGQPDVHPGGISFYRRINISCNTSKLNDRVELGPYLCFSHSENCSIQVNIFAS